MAKRLYLLDGMALAYRAHFAFMQRPIRTSTGINTSALFGFTNTLLEIIERESPTHLAVVFDTPAPTARHREFPDYKAQREAMPEDLVVAIPNLFRLSSALRIPALKLDGYEADDLIGTLVKRAGNEGFLSFMVTSDKDFGQLVSEHAVIVKPGKGPGGPERLGVREVCEKWGIQRPEQVIDVLALWGDASDNIPGVPGIGEKTAAKLIAQYDNLDNLLEHTAELKGKLKESIETHREQARLCRRLATIQTDVPIDVRLDDLALRSPDLDAWRAFCNEFEFSSLGRRLLGEGFKPGMNTPAPSAALPAVTGDSPQGELDLFGSIDTPQTESAPADVPPAAASVPGGSPLRTIAEVPHRYVTADTPESRNALLTQLRTLKSFCFDTETSSLDTRTASLVGVAFSWESHTGWYLPLPEARDEALALLEPFRPVFADDAVEKIGHNLKFDVSVLLWHGIEVRGGLLDTMIVHALVEPELRHGMDYLSERLLGYAPIPIKALIGEDGSRTMREVPVSQVAEYAAEDADITWQLGLLLRPQLSEKGQSRLYWEAEAPLIGVLARMEKEGIRMDPAALGEFSRQLSQEMEKQTLRIHALAGVEFNLNSPKQLGEVLFDRLKLLEKPRKTRTGQYATSETILLDLAPRHEIIRCILDYREASKLKSTYVDALPTMILPGTGRIHTTYQQVLAVTGRLSSHDPNLQNIPIRSQLGQEIRRAFLPRDSRHRLLSADYSQIELRIIAALSQDRAMQEAFAAGVDIHTATAAGVYDVLPALVTSEMRRTAKMVNFGIAYGISAFGLAQRLGISRTEAAGIIDSYFRRYSGIRQYMETLLDFARTNGYVETVLGRRRYLPDIGSANAAVRSAAERNAINMPIQGTAADMIKVAMIRIDREFQVRRLESRMLLQIHDELVFDLVPDEEALVREVVVREMKHALPLAVPIEVEIGVGPNWLDAQSAD